MIRRSPSICGISPTAQLPLPSGPTLAGTLEGEIKAVPGVALVSPSRMINVQLGPEIAVLRTVSAAGLEHEHYPVVDGDIGCCSRWVRRGRRRIDQRQSFVPASVCAWRPIQPRDAFGAACVPRRRVVLDYTLDVGTIILDQRYLPRAVARRPGRAAS